MLQPKFNIGDIVMVDDDHAPRTITEVQCTYTATSSTILYYALSAMGSTRGFSESRLSAYVAPRPTVMVELDAEVAEHAVRVLGDMCPNDWKEMICKLNLSGDPDDPINPRHMIDGWDWSHALYTALKAATDSGESK